MTEFIIPRALSTCGNCRYGAIIPEQLGVVECNGVPPTPVMVAVGQNLAGQQQMSIQLFRARLDMRQASCALWAAKEAAELTASSAAVRV
jgi:hypothetical protein